MTPKLSSAARMDGAFQNYGCVTLTTIAGTILMSQRTCVVRGIAQLDGNDVPVNPTIDASQNGFSAMAKTIVATTVMNFLKIVPCVSLTPTSSVTIIAAFQNNGRAILLMTVEMDLMRQNLNAKENIENVLNLSSDAKMGNVFQVDGDVVREINNSLCFKISGIFLFFQRS